MYVEVARVGHLVEEGAEEVVEVLLEALGEEKSHIVQTSKEVIPGFNRLVEMLGEKIQRLGGQLGDPHIKILINSQGIFPLLCRRQPKRSLEGECPKCESHAQKQGRVCQAKPHPVVLWWDLVCRK